MPTTITTIARRLSEAPAFEYFIIGVIIFNGVLLGASTIPTIEGRFGDVIVTLNYVALGIFIAEALLKMVASKPIFGGYLRDGWNVFDFLVIVFALIPFTGEFAQVARLARLLRVVRLISTIRDLRLIVAALVRSIPSVGHVMMLMGIIMYIYSIMGYHLFSQHDPENWGSLGKSVLTLFNIITLEGWTEIMATAMELYPLAWIYFVSYVVIATFVVINLFIAIIINNLDEAKLDRLRDIQRPVSREELLAEIRATQESLLRLEARLDATEDEKNDV